MNIEIGDKEIDFVFQGDRLIYPSYAGKESMVLHYDFSGMGNNDVTKGIARDLSGNGNNGTLQGFGYVAGSGYDNGLVFDGVDDYVSMLLGSTVIGPRTIEVVMQVDKTHLEAGRQEVISPQFYIHQTNGYIYLFNTSRYLVRNDEYPINKKFLLTITSDGTIFGSDGFVNSLIGSKSGGVDGDLFAIPLNPIISHTSNHFNGEVCSLRIYSTALTPEQIQHNYLIDKQRFNLP